MKHYTLQRILQLAFGGRDELSSRDDADRANTVISEAEVELQRMKQLVTRSVLESYAENNLRRWNPTLEGGMETKVRDDVKVIVMWGENPGYPDPAYALIVNPFGPSRIRVNLDNMHDLDELIRVLSIPPTPHLSE